MFRRLTLAAAVTFAIGTVHAQDSKPADWIARSNADAQALLDITARFSPESATDIGIKGYDEKTADLSADADKRQREALVAARAKYAQRLAEEKDPNVHQDLQILIKQIDGSIKGIDLNDKYLLPWYDAGQIIFSGEFSLLNEQSTPEQNQAALAVHPGNLRGERHRIRAKLNVDGQHLKRRDRVDDLLPFRRRHRQDDPVAGAALSGRDEAVHAAAESAGQAH